MSDNQSSLGTFDNEIEEPDEDEFIQIYCKISDNVAAVVAPQEDISRREVLSGDTKSGYLTNLHAAAMALSVLHEEFPDRPGRIHHPEEGTRRVIEGRGHDDHSTKKKKIISDIRTVRRNHEPLIQVKNVSGSNPAEGVIDPSS